MEQNLELPPWKNSQWSTMWSNNIAAILREAQGGLDPLYLRATLDPSAHVTLNAEINSFPCLTLVDLGATGIFLHPSFVEQCNVVLQLKAIPREVRVIDGRMISSGLIAHEAIVELIIGNHRERLVTDVTNTGRYPCILGIPSLICHDPTIRWSQQSVVFDSPYCQVLYIVQAVQKERKNYEAMECRESPNNCIKKKLSIMQAVQGERKNYKATECGEDEKKLKF